MSKDFIKNILNQNSNCQNSVSERIARQNAANKEELINRGLAIFENFDSADCLLSLYFVDNCFFANIKTYNQLTVVDKQKIAKAFEDEFGYPINFLV